MVSDVERILAEARAKRERAKNIREVAFVMARAQDQGRLAQEADQLLFEAAVLEQQADGLH